MKVPTFPPLKVGQGETLSIYVQQILSAEPEPHILLFDYFYLTATRTQSLGEVK